MPELSPVELAQLQKAGFVYMEPEIEIPRLVCCTAAGEKSGKTHWALTAPGPIGVLSTDTGTREIVDKFVRSGKQIFYNSLTSAKELMEDRAGKDGGMKEWVKARDAVRRIVDTQSIRTFIGDTGDGLWEILRLGKFGKLTQVMPHQYVEANDEFRSLIKYVYERPDLNAIFVHKVKKEYKQAKDGKDSWTGKWERAGFNDMPYLVDINLEHYTRTFDDGQVGLDFGIRVKDSRKSPDRTVGLTLEGPMCDFMSLASEAYPDTDLAYWMD